MSVSIADVRSWLGESAYDLAALFRSSRINKWARYKPVASSRTDIASRAQYEQMASAVTVCWGFDRTSFISGTSIGDLANAAAAGGADWRYNRPTSGVCRLGDFDGYVHSAQPPCSLSLPSGTVLTGTSIRLSLTPNAKSGGLGLVDFKAAFGGDFAWNSLRWAVARITNRNAVSQKVVMDLGGYVKDGNYTWTYTPPVGTFELLVMATNAPSADAIGGAYYYLLIPGGYTSLEVVSSMLQFTVTSFEKQYDAPSANVIRLSVTVTLRNRSSVSMPVGFWLVINQGSGGGVISLNSYYRQGTNVLDRDMGMIGGTPQKYLFIPAKDTYTVTATWTGSMGVTRRPTAGLQLELPDGPAYYTPKGNEVSSIDAAMMDIGLI